MASTPSAVEMLDREFLPIRCRLLDIASALDRIDRAGGTAGHQAVASDPRMAALRAAAAVLFDGQPDRARRVQMVFSDAYDETWRSAD